jgi:hypothetical protein
MAIIRHSTLDATYYTTTPLFATGSSALNALANGAFSAVSAEVDNTPGTGTYLFGDFLFTGGGSIDPVAGGYIGLYILPAIDGTNYPVTGSSSISPGDAYYKGAISLSDTAGTSYGACNDVQLPPFKFKVIIQNASGVALHASTNNTLKMYRRNLDVT